MHISTKISVKMPKVSVECLKLALAQIRLHSLCVFTDIDDVTHVCINILSHHQHHLVWNNQEIKRSIRVWLEKRLVYKSWQSRRAGAGKRRYSTISNSTLTISNKTLTISTAITIINISTMTVTKITVVTRPVWFDFFLEFSKLPSKSR